MVLHRQRELVDNAFFKAIDELDDAAVQMEGFKKMYPGSFRKDKATVQKLNQTFADRAKQASFIEEGKDELDQRAIVLEAILNEQVELSEWFGPKTYTIKTSDYDDFVNGTDIIIMLDGKIPIAIDVTSSSKSIPGKIDKIAHEIKNGQLTTVKYFEDEMTGEKGKKKRVPKFIIGAGPRTLDELIQLWMAKDKKQLANHPVQLELIQEIIVQAERYSKYAQKNERKFIAGNFKKIRQRLEDLFYEKLSSVAFPMSFERFVQGDPIYETIEREME